MQRPGQNGRYPEMNEGRRTEIILLDDRRLDILVQPRLFVSELLNIIASHCHLKDPDKQYFGITFYDERQQCHWLQSDRRVLDHEFPKKVTSGGPLVLHHQVKFYVESATQLAHPASVELLFLQTRMQFQKSLIQADYSTLVQITAFALQACFGDFKNISAAKSNLKRLALLPPTRFGENRKSSECEDRVLEVYENLSGLSKGNALVNYMSCLERLNTYGVHMYEVKEKSGTRLLLGISTRGIYQYELGSMDKPKKGFHWKQLENLYYRDRKFSIEVHDPKRIVNGLSSFTVYEDLEETSEVDDLTEALSDPSTQVSLSRRTFMPSNLYVHAFWCDTAQLCKTIWSLAISQHQFYLDRRAAAKKGTQFMHHTPRELAEKLDQGLLVIGNTASLFQPVVRNGAESSDLGSSVSSQSVHSIPSTCSAERSEDDRQRDLEIHKKLRQRKRDLEEAMLQKLKELKDVCVKEGEITGSLPTEIRLALVPGEAEPKIKRRVGTAFSIASETMSKHTKVDQVAKLEADVEIHRKIVAAALKLASDSSTNKSVRRKRRRDYESARQRLRELEQRLHQLRLSSSKPDLANARFEGLSSACTETEPGNFRICKSLPNTPRGSVPDLTDSLPIDPNDWRADQRMPNLDTSRSLRHGEKYNRLHYSTSFPVGVGHRSSTIGGPAIARGDAETFRADIPQEYWSHSINQSTYPRTAIPSTLPSGLTSEYSRSNSSSSAAPDHGSVTTIPSQRDVGAYNIPNQRTSWDYDSAEQGSADCVAAGSSESLNVGLHPHYDKKTRPACSSTVSNCYTGSLDRRVLKNLHRDKWRPVHIAEESKLVRQSYMAIPRVSPTTIEHLERSPTRYKPPPMYQARHSGDFSSATTAISPRLVHKLLDPNREPPAQGHYESLKQEERSMRSTGSRSVQSNGSRSIQSNASRSVQSTGSRSRQHVQRSVSQSSPVYTNRMTSIQEQRVDDGNEPAWSRNEKEGQKTATIV